MRFASTLEVDGAKGLLSTLRGSEFTGGKEGGGDRSHLRETVVNETGPRVHHRAPSRYPPVASSDDVSAGPETSSCVGEGSEWDEGAPFASSGRSRRRWAARRILLLRS